MHCLDLCSGCCDVCDLEDDRSPRNKRDPKKRERLPQNSGLSDEGYSGDDEVTQYPAVDFEYVASLPDEDKEFGSEGPDSVLRKPSTMDGAGKGSSLAEQSSVLQVDRPLSYDDSELDRKGLNKRNLLLFRTKLQETVDRKPMGPPSNFEETDMWNMGFVRKVSGTWHFIDIYIAHLILAMLLCCEVIPRRACNESHSYS